MAVRVASSLKLAVTFVACLPFFAQADSSASGVSGPWSVSIGVKKIREQELKFDSATDTLVVGAQSVTIDSSGGTEKIERDDAILRLGYQLNPVIKFSGLLGTTKVHSLNVFDAATGSVYGVGISAIRPSSSAMALGIYADVLRSTSKEDNVPVYFNATSSDGIPFGYVRGDVELDNKLESTELNLAIVATYNASFVKPYFGFLYSTISGNYSAHLDGVVSSCDLTCTSASPSTMTLDEKAEISLDSQLGLTLGIDAIIADNTSVGIGAIFGTRTEYYAHAEITF